MVSQPDDNLVHCFPQPGGGRDFLGQALQAGDAGGRGRGGESPGGGEHVHCEHRVIHCHPAHKGDQQLHCAEYCEVIIYLDLRFYVKAETDYSSTFFVDVSILVSALININLVNSNLFSSRKSFYLCGKLLETIIDRNLIYFQVD